MTKATLIANPLADHNELVVGICKSLGKDKNKRKIFEFLYGRGSKPRSTAEIAAAVSAPEQSIINAIQSLASDGIVTFTNIAPKDGGRAVKGYSKQPNLAGLKKKVIRGLDNPPSLKKIPTKWTPATVTASTIRLSVPKKSVKVREIHLEDIGTFKKARKVKPTSLRLDKIGERAFANGIQRITNEPGVFKDWGGESSDFLTSRLEVKGRRRTAAFAFKGKGQPSRLVPAKMGKNGDQAQRLFAEAAEVFVVQHWREIDGSVRRLVEQLAIAKSFSTGKEVFFWILDGQDSMRIVEAYPKSFT